MGCKQTISSNRDIEPVIRSNSSDTSRAAPPGRLIAISARVEGCLEVNVLDGFLPVAKRVHFGLSDDGYALVDELLDTWRRLWLRRESVVKSLVALRNPGALDMDVVFDNDTKPGNLAVSCRPCFDARAEGKAG